MRSEKSVDVSYELYTRWMRPHTFDFEVVIRGLDAQPAKPEGFEDGE